MRSRAAGHRLLAATALPAMLSVALLGAPPAVAEPRSAIPWLSQSIEIDRSPPPGRPASAGGGATDPVGGEITVTTLGEVSRDAVGLLQPEETGLPRALWGPVPAGDVAGMIADEPDQGVPAARALFQTLLLAEADPPPPGGEGADDGTGVLIARVDRLLGIGALVDARALIEAAGPDTPDLFRRWFDIGLLLDEAQEPCAALRQNPALSPTLPARVFCLARGGDWNAAEITLTLGQQVGSIPPDEEALLARFLDPELFEDAEEEPPIPDPLTPLDFLMREAVGLPRPPGPLPLAFLHTELAEHVPMRQRVEAAERLVISGAIAPAILFAAYRSGTPAASGGVWDRAQAVQALDRALAQEPARPADVGAALVAADAALAPRGLRVALATAMAPELADIDPASLAPDQRTTLLELALLSGDTAAALRAAGPEPDPRVAGLLAIAGLAPAPDAAPPDPALAAALAGLGDPAPADERAARLVALVGSGQAGGALLGALALIGNGPSADLPALRAALATIVAAGQAGPARQIALQSLLPGPGA